MDVDGFLHQQKCRSHRPKVADLVRRRLVITHMDDLLYQLRGKVTRSKGTREGCVRSARGGLRVRQHSKRYSEAIRGNQALIRRGGFGGAAGASGAVGASGASGASEVIRGNQRQSEVIRGNQRPSQAARAAQWRGRSIARDTPGGTPRMACTRSHEKVQTCARQQGGAQESGAFVNEKQTKSSHRSKILEGLAVS